MENKSQYYSSVLRKFIDKVNSATKENLEKIKWEITMEIGLSKMNPKTAKQIQATVQEQTTVTDLQRYIFNSMLRFEGLSVNRYKK